MAKKIITTDIPSLDVAWENYAGSSVEKFIKGELKNTCGYIYRSPQKEGDYYYLYGFRNMEEWDEWLSGGDITPLFRVQLPNLENDTFTSYIYTDSDTNKLVNLGAGIRLHVRFTSTQSNPTTGITTNTGNEGTLIIMRSANGSAFVEVNRRTIQSIPIENTESYTTIDVTPYLLDGNNKIRFRVEDNVNGTISNNITFNSIINTTLRVESATDLTKPLRSMTLQYYLEGQVAKTLNLKVTSDGTSDTFSLPIGESTYIEVPYTAFIDQSFTTGVKQVEAWLSVDDTDLESVHVFSQFYYINDDSSQGVIVLNEKATEITNYANTKFFSFALYNKNSDVDITVTDGTNTYLHYTYQNCLVGQVYEFYNTLEIDSVLNYLDLTVVVKTVDQTESYSIRVDNTEKMTPTAGADFVLNPKVRSNSETNPGRIINEVSGDTIQADFNGFSFINDGWLSDSDGIRILSIPAGKSVQIYYDPLDTLTEGTTIELDYKVKNVYNDDTVIAKFCSYDQNDHPVGFEMKSTEAAFFTVDNQTRRDQDVMFQEDTRTHLAINIVPNLSGTGLNYIRIFINGVMNREMTYALGDTFRLETLSMIFGSADADIDIYSIRVYKKGLSASDVRQDYMSSLPTLEEKINFKTVNDILSANGTISFDKASVKYNTLVWTGNHPEYSTGKVDYYGDLQINIVDDPAHSGNINGMKISGQGSSSRGYWKWNHTFKFQDNSAWTDGNGDIHRDGYKLTDDDPAGKELVSKLNWASSMQSHKIGSTALYNDLWKEIIGGSTITKNKDSQNARVAVHEKPFLYFTRQTANSNPVFAGLVTFGSAKGDKTTFLGNTDVWDNNTLCLEGSDNGMPLLCRQVPWIAEEITYDSGEKFYTYAGQGNWDYLFGNKNRLNYFMDASNFVYLHSPALRPYTDGSDMDPAYQYWDKSTGRVIRYDHITKDWVNAGTAKDGNGYTVLNIFTQTGIQATGNWEVDNANFIDWRVSDFKQKVSIYYDVNDVLFSMAFLKMIAGSDNRAKNTYEYLDPGSMKIRLLQDDMDTIMLTDNVGRKTKPYYVEEHDMNGVNPFFNGEDNNFFNLMDLAFNTELRAMMKSILDTMRSSKYGGSVQACMDRYFFNIQRYFPAVAFNEAARLLYEEASVAQANGEYRNGTPAISQSLGNQLEAELQWWKRREKYLESWAGAVPFYVRSEHSLGFRSLLTTASQRPNYSFTVTPWQYLYPKVGVGQSMGADNTRVANGSTYNTSTITTDGNTDMFIYGADYYKSFGEFGDKSVGETFELAGLHLEEFSADSRQVQSYQFRPIAFSVNCPNLKRLCLYGCSTLTGNLNLGSLSKLVSVDLRGTGITSITLPETDTLTQAYLPAGISSLVVNNCPNLTVDNATIAQLTSIETNSSSLAKQCMTSGSSNLVQVKFNDINVVTSGSTEGGNIYNWLLRDDVQKTITGKVYIDLELDENQMNALEAKYGNGIFNQGSSFWIDYVKNPISEPVMSPTSLTMGPGETAEINVAYVGNMIDGWDWTSSSPTITLTKTRKKVTITTPASLARPESITITYQVTGGGTTYTKQCALTLISTNFMIDGEAMNTVQNTYAGVGASTAGGSFTISDTAGNTNWSVTSFSGNGIAATISGKTVTYSIANPITDSSYTGTLTITQEEFTYTYQITIRVNQIRLMVTGPDGITRNTKTSVTVQYQLATSPQSVTLNSATASFGTSVGTISQSFNSSTGVLEIVIPKGDAEGTINTILGITATDAGGATYQKSINFSCVTVSKEPKIIVDYEWNVQQTTPLVLMKVLCESDPNVHPTDVNGNQKTVHTFGWSDINDITYLQTTLPGDPTILDDVSGYKFINVDGEGFMRVQYSADSLGNIAINFSNLFKNVMAIRRVEFIDFDIASLANCFYFDGDAPTQCANETIERIKFTGCKTAGDFYGDNTSASATSETWKSLALNISGFVKNRNVIKIDMRTLSHPVSWINSNGDTISGNWLVIGRMTDAFKVSNATEPCVLYLSDVSGVNTTGWFKKSDFAASNDLVHCILYSGYMYSSSSMYSEGNPFVGLRQGMSTDWGDNTDVVSNVWKVIKGGSKTHYTSEADKILHGDCLVWISDTDGTVITPYLQNAMNMGTIKIYSSKSPSSGYASCAASYTIDKGDYLSLVGTGTTTYTDNNNYVKFTGNGDGSYRELGYIDSSLYGTPDSSTSNKPLYSFHDSDYAIKWGGDFMMSNSELPGSIESIYRYCRSLTRGSEYLFKSIKYGYNKTAIVDTSEYACEFGYGSSTFQDCTSLKYILVDWLPGYNESTFKKCTGLVIMPSRLGCDSITNNNRTPNYNYCFAEAVCKNHRPIRLTSHKLIGNETKLVPSFKNTFEESNTISKLIIGDGYYNQFDSCCRRCSSIEEVIAENPNFGAGHVMFNKAFECCGNLTKAFTTGIPTSTITSSCNQYCHTFYACFNLTQVGEFYPNNTALPRLVGMFAFCTHLTTGPASIWKSVNVYVNYSLYNSVVQKPGIGSGSNSISKVTIQTYPNYDTRLDSLLPNDMNAYRFVSDSSGDNQFANKMFYGCLDLTDFPDGYTNPTVIRGINYNGNNVPLWDVSEIFAYVNIPTKVLKLSDNITNYYNGSYAKIPINSMKSSWGYYDSGFKRILNYGGCKNIQIISGSGDLKLCPYFILQNATFADSEVNFTISGYSQYGTYAFGGTSGIVTLTTNCKGNYLCENSVDLENVTLTNETQLSSGEFNNAFSGCSKLSYVKAMFTGSNFGTGYTTDWLSGVASGGTYVMNGNATYDTTIRNGSGIPSTWTIETALN